MITDAKIVIDEFDLRRVSKAGGEIAQQVGRVARKELESKIDEKEKKLVKKMNQEISENPDKLRVSISQAIQSKWFNQAQQHLPENIKNAIIANSSSAGQNRSNSNSPGTKQERNAQSNQRARR